MKILAYVAVRDGRISRASLEALSLGRRLARARGGSLEAVAAAPDDRWIEELRRYGPSRIHAVIHPAFEKHLNRTLLAALEGVIEAADPTLVLFPASGGVRDVLGALAARTGTAALPDVVGLEVDAQGRPEALRPVLAGRFLARTVAEAPRVLVSVRGGAFEASEEPADAEVVRVPFTPPDEAAGRVRLREVVASTARGADLSEAGAVVAAGRGVRDERGRDLVVALAEALGGAVGASRAAVENGFFPAASQIGQTGRTVSPELYVSVGISGAIQHTAGMTGSRTVVAINRDPEAPIFQYATYGLVGDLYEIVPALLEALEQERA